MLLWVSGLSWAGVVEDTMDLGFLLSEGHVMVLFRFFALLLLLGVRMIKGYMESLLKALKFLQSVCLGLMFDMCMFCIWGSFFWQKCNLKGLSSS